MRFEHPIVFLAIYLPLIAVAQPVEHPRNDALFLSSVATAHSTEGAQPTVPCFKFDIALYKDSEEVKRALDKCHPVGSDATELLKQQLSSDLKGLRVVSESEFLKEKLENLPPLFKIEKMADRLDVLQYRSVRFAVFSRLKHVGHRLCLSRFGGQSVL